MEVVYIVPLVISLAILVPYCYKKAKVSAYSLYQTLFYYSNAPLEAANSLFPQCTCAAV